MAARRDVFQAIADPTRRQIIHLLSKQSLSLNSIADNFDTSRPAISKHIRILEECGMITIRQEGRERYCYVQLKKLKEAAGLTVASFHLQPIRIYQLPLRQMTSCNAPVLNPLTLTHPELMDIFAQMSGPRS